jgi:predicted ATPase
LGSWDRALQTIDAAIALARQLGHPFSLNYALHHDSMIQCLRRTPLAVLPRAAAVIELARQHRLGQFLPLGNSFHGWALAGQGQFEAGVAELREGMEAYREQGNEHVRPYLLTLLAEQHGKAGDVEQGLALLAEALALLEASGERWCEAETRRVTGELLLRTGHAAQGEAALSQAIEVARTQQARSFELRAAVSLARLWQSQARTAAARQLVSPIVSWFGEQVETRDLREARSLLASLEKESSKQLPDFAGTEVMP